MNKEQRLSPAGTSDPISYTCTCPARHLGGSILLFYRYYGASPPLPSAAAAVATVLTDDEAGGDGENAKEKKGAAAAAAAEEEDGDRSPTALAAFHSRLCSTFRLGGKIRVAAEGFNVTVGGTRPAVAAYVAACAAHWSLAGLQLATRAARDAFFKPAPGCACAFSADNGGGGGGNGSGSGNGASVRVVEEITPLGVAGYAPRDWGRVRALGPEEYHERLVRRSSTRRGEGEAEAVEEMSLVLLDVRNHYESRIGYFVDPATEREAVRPAIRRFSQWPAFVQRFLEGMEREREMEQQHQQQHRQQNLPEGEEEPLGWRETEDDDDDERKAEKHGMRHAAARGRKRQIMTYCTGGIRCEKGVRWMAENAQLRDDDEVFTLEGGIAAYLAWMDAEIGAGRKTPADSLFRGRNYVFDGRGSTGLSSSSSSSSSSGCDGGGGSGGGGGGSSSAAVAMEMAPVAECHGCGKAEDRLGKCRSRRCHLVLVVCEECEAGRDVRCCRSCEEMDDFIVTEGSGELSGETRRMCACETEREKMLWGDGGSKIKKAKPRRGPKGTSIGCQDTIIEVKIKLIE